MTKVDDRLTVKGEGDKAEAKRDSAQPDAAAPGRPDAWLTAKIQAKYFVDDEVKGREIDVDTQNGMVTLKGRVDNESQRRQAVAIARNTDGVRGVIDHLQVQSEAADSAGGGARPKPLPVVNDVSRPDSWITMKIQSKYFLDADVKGHRIDVDTHDGVVTLKGTVATADLKQQAERIARDTEGVTRVNNQIQIGSAQR